MTTQSCCQFCEGHMKEWEIAQSTISMLRSIVDELYLHEKEAINRERCIQEQLCTSLSREQELLSLLDKVRRENLSLSAVVQSSGIHKNATIAKSSRVPQDTTKLSPQTLATVNEVMAPSSRNIELSENHTISEVVEVGHPLERSLGLNVGPAFPTKVSIMVETHVQLMTPKVESTIQISLNPRFIDIGCDLKRQGGNIDEGQTTSRELSEQRTHEQAENDHEDIPFEHKKESQFSRETQSLDNTKLLETVANESRRNVEAPKPSLNHVESETIRCSNSERETTVSKTCKSNIEELNVVACGLEHVGVHDNMNQIQVQNHHCDGGGCQQGSELPLDKGLGTNLVVTHGVVGEGNTICTLEANHMDHVERSTNSGSQGTRKYRRRNLIQVLSDEENEDNVISPPAKKSLFKTSYGYAASIATPLKNNLQLQELYSSSSTPEASRMAAIVGMEFGGGISVTEFVTEELETNGKAIPKYPLNRPRRKKTIELLSSGNANVTNDHVEVGLIRSKRLRRLSSSTPTNDHPRTSKRLSSRGEKNAPNTEYAKGSLEVEDEVECSDKDTNSFIGDSSEASSESSRSRRQFVETYKSSKPRENITTDTSLIDLTNSDSDSDILLRHMVRSKHNKHTSFETEPQKSESSKSPHRNSSHEISSPSNAGQVENLLKLSSDDLDINDVEMDDSVDSLRRFIVYSSEDSVSNGEGEISDSDSREGDSGSQETFREEIVRKRQNLIWDFEGDMLAAMQNNIEVALQAVCALYRQQTKDEQRTKDAIYSNGRGFNKANALRGSKYAEFLIDGDEFGQLRKSARALESQFRGATKDCQSIAAHHSKQLFEIYSNLEDQFWRKPTG